jgi:hypothetical protein
MLKLPKGLIRFLLDRLQHMRLVFLVRFLHFALESDFPLSPATIKEKSDDQG